MGLEERIRDAWNRLSPKILSDPDELAKRLARRRSAMMLRPPRAWCLALRANDRRIHLPHAIIEPPYAAMRRQAHEVTLTSALLRRLCRPAYIPRPGEEPVEIAKRLLGARGSAMHNARKAGVFRERFVKGLAGKRGHPVPLIYTEEPLDPGSMFRWQYPHPLWNTRVRYLGDHVPDGISQILRRVPTQKEVPHDRSNLYYAGWRWICPGCELPVRMILYPLVTFNTIILLEKEFPQDHPDALPSVRSGFACWRCHRVRSGTYFSKCDWNYIITQFSGGLLYGYEVPKVLHFERKRPYRPHFNAPPSKRREEVMQLLLAGKTIKETAKELGISFLNAQKRLKEIYAQHRVHSRQELQRLLKVPETGNELRQRKVLKLLLEGLPRKKIAESLGVVIERVHYDCLKIYRENKVSGRDELRHKLNREGRTEASSVRQF